MTAKPASEADLLKLADLLHELNNQVSCIASEDALQSFPVLGRQIERADKLRGRIEEFRAKLSAEGSAQ